MAEALIHRGDITDEMHRRLAREHLALAREAEAPPSRRSQDGAATIQEGDHLPVGQCHSGKITSMRRSRNRHASTAVID